MLESKSFWQQQHTSHLMKRMTDGPTNVVFTSHGLHLRGKVKVGSSWLHCASSLSLSFSLLLSVSLSVSFFLSPGAVNVVKQNLAQKMVPATFDQPWNEMNVQSSLLLEFHTLHHCPCDSIQEKTDIFTRPQTLWMKNEELTRGSRYSFCSCCFYHFSLFIAFFCWEKKCNSPQSKPFFFQQPTNVRSKQKNDLSVLFGVTLYHHGRKQRENNNVHLT